MKLLLHICCAPCACYTLKKLREEGFDVVGFWFNPNIHPYKEYLNRLETLKLFAEYVSLELVIQDFYRVGEFFRLIMGKEEFGVRCESCYLWRIEKVAGFALENGYDAFTTTLLYSRYQNHQKIKEICEKISKQYGIRFYYYDFRCGWNEGISIAKSLGLYRQAYCGCIFSEYEAIMSRKKTGDALAETRKSGKTSEK